mmetsp:Transcript_7918/g.18216  ORF Transcript_7918/g.18216 Transcript_7918/m.18216 type:complete len:606 (+) Transcript_7918:86-1903(+)|eukprot:CAMPEP_0197891856 /NCGR_PEP_ID=MMETSP1439-20131203/29832_1 /TAXON_ID=66791 /ORGANISM="Gonyaulax spinifera, Strain CCMP409" /LENGTH=605 /DNA_ID=CAMNT_0043511993 /DNA_START=80 /DNA_END=1897 /DNA_ORIENTATION=+
MVRLGSALSLALTLVAPVHSADAAKAGADCPAPPVPLTQGAAYLQTRQLVQRKPVSSQMLSLGEEEDEDHTDASCCHPLGQWPSVDNGVTCGPCRALVLTWPYGGRCDRYCASFGHECVAAAEERAEGCDVKSEHACDEPITGTSDMLCTCRLPNSPGSCAGLAPAPAPKPIQPPAPAPAKPACCAPFGKWPSVDRDVTCGDCRALVLTAPYGGRCDHYCKSFGHVCVAAEEESDEGCDVKSKHACDEEIRDTSDMLCTCRLPDAAPMCAAPEPAPVPTPQPLPGPSPAPSGRPRIEIAGRQLLVNGKPLHLKGVAWNPVPRGARHPDGLDFAGHVERDAELMVQAGINAVRTYTTISDRGVLDALWNKGIWVVNDVYAYGGSRPEQAVDRVRSAIDHPAVLMWTVGNEWNYNGFYVGLSRRASEERVATVTRLVKQADPSRPVASIYGEVPSRDLVEKLRDVDVWGINAYRGISFGNLFDTYSAHSRKPMFLGEYGADAFNANIDREDQRAQAKATKELTQQIVDRSAVRDGGVCLGGFVFELADEWWKDGKGSSWKHDTGGVAPGGGPYPDQTFNEEWWGLVTVDRVPRLALNAYAEVSLPTA